ncbi:DUF262 domain-containing protein [Amorphus coralli]|uniref:DUF262 domain-containing protein n=1 Tax=Amorphus coralli TaxID=340680 RepID=UPI00041BFC65|nr:DUF262 domain-containing protein [Amorphus coralli]
MKITPVSKTLSEVLRGHFLKIPRFQRPYDWDRDNLTEFWNDLKDRSDPEYFMGSLVVFADKKEKNLLLIVDGQQRITTITIMLSIIRDKLADYSEFGPSEAINELIESRGLDNKKRFVLEHDPPDRYMQSAIQSKRTDDSIIPDGPQQESISAAHRFLQNALQQHLKSEYESRKTDIVSYLKHLRDCILQMHFISIELDNEDDAYIIFETLNTRGKDLRVSDLLKNHFMRLMTPSVKSLDLAKDDWHYIIENLNSVTTSIDPDSFLLHYWLSRQSSVSKAKLFSSFKKSIKKTNAKAWLSDIKDASSIYIKCVAPNEVTFSKQEKQIQESLNAIRIFGVAQAAPLMLAIMTQYNKQTISMKTTRAAFELIEKFTFQFNALTQSRGGGGVSNMYAKLAQTTMSCRDSQEFANLLGDMKEKFTERIPDRTEFSVPFSRLTYRTNYTRERNLVKYVLIKIAKHYGMPNVIDSSLLTIEHILPQSKGEETNDEFDYGAIGNLLLVGEKLNGKLGDKEFSKKKELFSTNNHVYLDDFLKAATTWNDQSIADRGVELAEVGYKQIWNLQREP